jgi:hypothetical protein
LETILQRHDETKAKFSRVPAPKPRIALTNRSGALVYSTTQEVIEELKKNKEKFIDLAQTIYDKALIRGEREEYGICADLVEAWHSLIPKSFISGPESDEEHTWLIVPCSDGTISLDIPYTKYELGQTDNYKLIPGVKFQLNDLVIRSHKKGDRSFRAAIALTNRKDNTLRGWWNNHLGSSIEKGLLQTGFQEEKAKRLSLIVWDDLDPNTRQVVRGWYYNRNRKIEAKMSPDYPYVYMGTCYEGIGIIFVTDSPITKGPRINYFFYPNFEISKFEDSHLTGQEWVNEYAPQFHQVFHIDSKEGHNTPTRLEVVADKQEFDQKLESLVESLDQVIKTSYDHSKDGIARLLDQINRKHLQYA